MLGNLERGTQMNSIRVAKILGLTVAMLFSLLVYEIQIKAYVSGPSPDPPLQQKPDCDQYYPLPSDYPNWTNCKNIGQSGCGGPQQCACDESQRLVTFKCDQGTYHQCYGEKGNGCRGQ